MVAPSFWIGRGSEVGGAPPRVTTPPAPAPAENARWRARMVGAKEAGEGATPLEKEPRFAPGRLEEEEEERCRGARRAEMSGRGAWWPCSCSECSSSSETTSSGGGERGGLGAGAGIAGGGAGLGGGRGAGLTSEGAGSRMDQRGQEGAVCSLQMLMLR